MSACFLFLWTGCEASSEEPAASGETLSYATRATVRSLTAEDTAFPEGARIRLYAEDGLSIPEGALDFMEGAWQTDEPYRWVEGEDSAFVVALYPALASYGTASLYDEEGRLTDVLYSVSRHPARQPLSLSLHHLFSQLTVKLDAPLKSSVSGISLKVPVTVKEISVPTAEVTLLSEEVTATQSYQGEDAVTFLIPSGNVLRLDLTLHDTDGTVSSYALTPALYQSGKSYTCTLSTASRAKGIHSVEEFLDMISNLEKNSTSILQKYGQTVDGHDEIQLLTDLDFTDVTISATQSLSFEPATPFCFNGLGHTLSQITSSRKALFNNLGAQVTLKNLNIQSSTVTSSSTGSGSLGVLVNDNSGTIDNCHVEDCLLATTSSKSNKMNAGLLAGQNFGLIVNCSASGSVTAGNSAGGCVGLLSKGSIVNCMAGTVTLNKATYRGGILGCMSSDSHSSSYLLNCWVGSCTTSSSTKAGLLAGDASQLTIQYCYSPSSTTLSAIGSASTDSKVSNTYTYDTSYAVTIHQEKVLLTDLLNQWITGRKYEFSGQTLIPWESGETTSTPSLR